MKDLENKCYELETRFGLFGVPSDKFIHTKTCKIKYKPQIDEKNNVETQKFK